MNRTVGAGRKGVAMFPPSAGIWQIQGEGDEAGVSGVSGQSEVAFRHFGAESELDLLNTPPSPPPLQLPFPSPRSSNGSSISCGKRSRAARPEKSGGTGAWGISRGRGAGGP